MHAALMAKPAIDMAVRSRIQAWLRYYADKYAHQYETQKDLAAAIGLSAPAVNMILSGRRTAGFDVAIKMHRKLHVSLDTLIDTDPPTERSGERTPNPATASPTRAGPGRRLKTGRV